MNDYQRRVAALEAEEENRRVQRLVILDDALSSVMANDGHVMTPEQAEALRAAYAAVGQLRKVW